LIQPAAGTWTGIYSRCAQVNKSTKEVQGDGCVDSILFGDGQPLPADMIMVSAGIRPRDDLARACKLKIAQRGGVVVTSFPTSGATARVTRNG